MPSALVRPTTREISDASCDKEWDRAPGDPETTTFKLVARLHQVRWREAHGFPMGTEPIADTGGQHVGSRLPLAFARETGANFLDRRVVDAVRDRLANPQRNETLGEQRLYANLLSSMPMCFNIFGTITDPETATRALRIWWPDTPGKVTRVIFEWSPGRCDPSYLGNKTSFDVAFLLDLGNGRNGVLAIETKYHEHPKPVGITPAHVKRYRDVSAASYAFTDTDLDALMRDEASQLWLDHLLVLAMLQHPSCAWHWARFITVYPDANPSWPRATTRYRALLHDDRTFGTATFDELVRCAALEPAVREALVTRDRCWE